MDRSGPPGRACQPRSPDTSPAAAAARRWRTASCSPGTPPPPSPDAPGDAACKCAPSSGRLLTSPPPGARRRPSPPPTPASRGCRRRPVPLPLDRHRPAAYHSPRFARSRPGARSEGHEIAQSDSFRTGLQGESLPICSGSAISTNAHAGDRCQWPSPPSAVPPATPASKPPDGPFTHIRRAARDAGQQTARRAVHPPSPRGLPPRRSRRHSRPPLTGPGLTADECGRHPRHLHAAAAQRRSSGR